ncbi:hypothetical protein GPALN_011606 [Globodera pallida]|nr:hypothetical protein GPALN_011606 [Globodera pallida]
MVNPFHDVEEFVTDSGIELVLLERMFNFEIMAGSYQMLAKNMRQRNFHNNGEIERGKEFTQGIMREKGVKVGAFNPWTNPFGDGQRFDSPKQCAANGSTTAWKYRDGFLVSEESIGKVLDGLIRRTREEYENTLRRLALTN